MRNVRRLSRQATLPIGLLGLLAVGGSSHRVPAQSTAPIQRPESAPVAKVILEVIATDFDIGKSEQYLYLRVSSDLSAEAQTQSSTTSGKRDAPVVRKTLRRGEFEKIQALLDRPDIPDLKTKYPSRLDFIDAGTSWDIKLLHKEHQQEIRLVAFDPHTARTLKRPYPDAVLKLGCVIEKLRISVSGEKFITAEECAGTLASIFEAGPSSHVRLSTRSSNTTTTASRLRDAIRTSKY